jgi:hypothetical protein
MILNTFKVISNDLNRRNELTKVTGMTLEAIMASLIPMKKNSTTITDRRPLKALLNTSPILFEMYFDISTDIPSSTP